MDFTEALRLAKAGQAIARAGWNGKGMFVYHVAANSYPAQSPVAKARFGEDAMVPYGAYLAMKTATGEVVPWLASQTDILAGDWDLAPADKPAQELIGGTVESHAIDKPLTPLPGTLVYQGDIS